MLKVVRCNIQSWKTKSNTLSLPKSITGNVGGNITTSLSSLVDIIVTVIGQLFMIVSLGVLLLGSVTMDFTREGYVLFFIYCVLSVWYGLEVKWDSSSLSASRWRMEELFWDCQCNLAPRLAAQPQKKYNVAVTVTSLTSIYDIILIYNTYIQNPIHMFKFTFDYRCFNHSII